MIKARASGSKVYLYFMKKGRQARHRIPQNSCEIILQEGSLGDPLPKCSNCSAPLNKMATRAKNRKTFKRLLPLNQKMDFEIIIQEFFLGDPLPKVLKEFRYVEQNGRQGYK